MDYRISICIPSYHQPELLERCLKSVLLQDYKNMEVIISDDTPDNSVKIIAGTYRSQLQINYYQNTPALGTPANWNAALDKGSGDLLMLLHHDDWLAGPKVISDCISLFKKNDKTSVVFGRSMAIDRKLKSKNDPFDATYFDQFYKHPGKLLLNNVIGPPSNVILRKTVKERYHLYYKWLVDLEFYYRLIVKGHYFTFYDRQLVLVGIHPEQMTNYCKEDGEIILRENIYFANQHLPNLKKGLKMYDHYWRLLRNNKSRSVNDLLLTGLNEKEIPGYIRQLINVQSKLPQFLLKGIFSKLFMLISYLLK